MDRLGMDASGKKTKDRVLKEVTNILEVQPAKLKTTWTGLKTGSGSTVREVGLINEWVAHGGGGRAC